MPQKTLKIVSSLLCLCLVFQQTGLAQGVAELNLAGHLASLASAFTSDKFRPLHLRYLAYDNLNNSFKLLLDEGDQKNLKEAELEALTQKLLEYFFIGVTLPNESFWVNLRPDSPKDIIDDSLAQTDMGTILLEADLQLKKDTANATSPATPEGKTYWDKLYKKAEELFASENLSIPTLVRPWIVPNEIILREADNNAYIYKVTLKVMLEEDYLRGTRDEGRGTTTDYSFKDPRLKALNEYSSQLLNELIIPKLTKEVNTSKRYAHLRQVYFSLILAQWFKTKFYGKGGLYSWLIDRKDLTNLTSNSPWNETTYFKQYQANFQQGEYDFKESVSTAFGQSIRTYFSGGIALQATTSAASPLQGVTTADIPAILSSKELSSSPLMPVSATVEISGVGRPLNRGSFLKIFFGGPIAMVASSQQLFGLGAMKYAAVVPGLKDLLGAETTDEIRATLAQLLEKKGYTQKSIPPFVDAFTAFLSDQNIVYSLLRIKQQYADALTPTISEKDNLQEIANMLLDLQDIFTRERIISDKDKYLQ